MPGTPRSTNKTAPTRLLITAGPTHEPIDAVRYLANRSSGRLGIELAAAAAERGLTVTLLLGPTALTPPADPRVTVTRFRTTEDLRRLLADRFPEHDILVMAAAVADYRPVDPANDKTKIPRSDSALTIRLKPTPDLVAKLAASARDDQTLIGFALEPDRTLEASARAKLERKGLDAIVANPLRTMEAEHITATVLLRDGRELRPPPDLAKREFAAWLLDRVEEMRAKDVVKARR